LKAQNQPTNKLPRNPSIFLPSSFPISNSRSHSNPSCFRALGCEGLAVPERGVRSVTYGVSTASLITGAWLRLHSTETVMLTLSDGDLIGCFLGWSSLISLSSSSTALYLVIPLPFLSSFFVLSFLLCFLQEIRTISCMNFDFFFEMNYRLLFRWSR